MRRKILFDIGCMEGFTEDCPPQGFSQNGFIARERMVDGMCMPAEEGKACCSIGLLGVMDESLMMPLSAQTFGIASKSHTVEGMMEGTAI